MHGRLRRSRRAGYPCVAHAGETGGPHHVRQAVENLRVQRIQHGVHAVDDVDVLRLLQERGICCDVTLSSNRFLTSFTDLSSHPVRTMIDAGIPVTLSTDDPPFFSTNLSREYEIAHCELGMKLEQLWEINLNGLRYGLASVGLRRRLMREFEAEAKRL